MLLIVPTFNNPTYVRNFINQVKAVNKFEIMIVDNNSSIREMTDLLYELEKEGIKIKILESNYGPRWIYENSSFYNYLPQKFCVSDPDIKFNSKLPSDFLDIMFEISDTFRIGKVGFAIENILNSKTSEQIKVAQISTTIFEYESQFWDLSRKIQQNSFSADLFLAPVDTTFAIHNKTWFHPKLNLDAIRVGGSYTCKHLPWTNEIEVPLEEKLFYQKFSSHSYYSGMRAEDGEPFMHISFTNYLDLMNEIGILKTKKTLKSRLLGRRPKWK
jgi:hypothetical protein